MHAHNAVFAGVCCQSLSSAEGIPYVLTEHSSAFSTGNIRISRDVKKAYREASARIMVSPYLGKKVEEAIGKETLPWEYIPNILDSRFVNNYTSNSVKPADTFCFLCVAQFVPIKNHIGLINAFSTLVGVRNDVELVLGGSGPMLAEIKAYVAKNKVCRHVKFLGALSREQVFSEMRQCDALVLPSFSETFGVVLIEAIACGKPVIAPSGSGCEAVVNPKNGLLFRPDDSQDLARAMVEMIEFSKTISPDAIRNECIATYGENKITAQLISVYDRIVSKTEANP